MRKVIKVFTVVYTCILIIVFGSSPAFATSDESILYGMTHDEMLQYGYIYDNGYYVLPSGIIPPEAYFPSLMLLTEPKYPKFDPAKLPWQDAPATVRELYNMPYPGVTCTDVDEYSMPFIAIRVNSSEVLVMAGLNCFLGTATKSSNNVRVCFLRSLSSTATAPTYSRCFSAKFTHDYKLISDWKVCSTRNWGDGGDVYTYNSTTFISPSYNVDLYVFGGNGGVAGSYSSFSSITGIAFPVNNDLGFSASPPRVITDDGSFTELFIDTFIPEPYNSIDNSSKDKLSAAEDALFASNYNPDNFSNDFKVNLDGSAINAVFAVMDSFIQLDSTVFGAFLTVLTIGVIALIFGR